MAIINALKTGNWSDTTVWPGGTLPGPTDQVQANGYTIIINQDITVASIRTTAEGGGAVKGYFSPNNGVVITADVIAGGTGSSGALDGSINSFTVIGNVYGADSGGDTEGIRAFPNGTTQVITIIGNVVARYGKGINVGGGTGYNTINVTGDVTGGANTSIYGINCVTPNVVTVTGNVTAGSGGSANGIQNASTGSVTVTGNVTGGSGATAYGINNASTGPVTVTGNITAGSGSNAYGINNASTGSVTVTGNVTAGSGATAYGLYNGSSGSVSVTGNVAASTGSGRGILNSSTGTMTITGNAIASLYAEGAWNSSTGILDLAGTAIGNDYKFGDPGGAYPGIYGHPSGSIFRRVTVSAIKYGAYGAAPTSGNVFIKKTATSTMTDNDGNLVTFVTSDSICDFPAESNVRLNTAYDNTNKVGTCAVPAAAAVSQGVAVDHTVGAAALTPQDVWEYATRTITSDDIIAQKVRVEIDSNSTKLINILGDTNELQTDWSNGGRLDNILDTSASNSLHGINRVTLGVFDGVTPISNVELHIYNINDLWVYSSETNVSGYSEVYLDDGEYTIRIRKTGVVFTNPETLTVSGNTTRLISGEILNVARLQYIFNCR